MMFGQMTAGSWIYIGSQGIVQGTYETFAEAGRQHYGGELADKWILTAGLGGMGGAQPLAATMAGASMLAIECQQSRIEMRLRDALPRSRRRATSTTRSRSSREACAARQVRCRWDCSAMRRRSCPSSSRRDVRPRHGHRPDVRARSRLRLSAGRLDAWSAGARRRPIRRSMPHLVAAAKRSIRAHVEAMLAFHAQGIPTFDYGNNIRQVAHDEGVADAFAFPGFVPAYIRPLFCEGKGPFRWVALSGDPEDIRTTDRKVQGAVSRQRAPASLARHGRRAHRVPGPARAHLLARPRRARIAPVSRSTRWWRAAS